jgi:two-component system chemotaxis response regulator CheY
MAEAKFSAFKVLIVDDELAIRNMIDFVLKDMGFKYTFLEANGAAAMESLNLAIEPFDLVICDWMMPEMNGLEFLKKARAMGCEASFVMLTAKNTEDAVVAAKDEGVDAYIAKPFTPHQLQIKIQSLFREK